jgi:hypothetical protein
MRLMQHMFPQLLTEVPVVALPAPGAKAFDPITAIANAVAGISGAVSSSSNARAAQEIARQQTLQADISARTAAEDRASMLTALKYVGPGLLIAFIAYLFLK